MTLAFELPDRPSFLRGLDPRWKLATLVPAAVLAALVRSWPAALAGLACSMVIVLLGRLPARWLLLRLGAALSFLGFFLAWLPFVSAPGEAVWNLGPLELSVPGTVRAGVLLAKGMTLLLLMVPLATTSPLPDTFKAAHALGVPGLVVQLLTMTLRYVFLLIDELKRLRLALRVRGYRNRARLHSWRTVGQVSGTMLVRGWERAERVGQAMRARGFDGTYRSLHQGRTSWRDVAFLLAGWSAFGGILTWDLLRTA